VTRATRLDRWVDGRCRVRDVREASAATNQSESESSSANGLLPMALVLILLIIVYGPGILSQVSSRRRARNSSMQRASRRGGYTRSLASPLRAASR
jgi:hypothetical protein